MIAASNSLPASADSVAMDFSAGQDLLEAAILALDPWPLWR